MTDEIRPPVGLTVTELADACRWTPIRVRRRVERGNLEIEVRDGGGIRVTPTAAAALIAEAAARRAADEFIQSLMAADTKTQGA